MHLGKNNSHSQYFLYDCPISATQHITDLGVDIDCNLNFDFHINKIIGKAYTRLGVLFRGFATRSAHILRLAFITFVRPLLEYASNVWSPHLLKHINAIEKIQKRFTKGIPSLSHLTYPERLAAINLEPLELRRLKMDLVLYYKCLNNLVALPPDVYFCSQHYVSQTRTGGNRLIVPLCSTNRFKNDFFNRCLICYNNLPVHIVTANSLSNFKRFLNNIDLSAFLHCNYF